MATRKLSLPQSIAVVLYVLFFAVQLHFRYVDLRIAGSDKYSSFAGRALESKQKKVSSKSSCDVPGNFNLSSSRRLF